jgi:hypothetical protein
MVSTGSPSTDPLLYFIASDGTLLIRDFTKYTRYGLFYEFFIICRENGGTTERTQSQADLHLTAVYFCHLLVLL